LTGYLGRLLSGMRGIWPRQGGGGFTSRWHLLAPGSNLDYEAIAGDVWLNSVVALGLKWMGDRASKPPVRLSKIARNGDYVPLPKSPAIDLWNRPNPWFSRLDMEAAVLLSLAVDGNGYVQKVRDGRGQVIELWWLPHFSVEPKWPNDGSTFIDSYQIEVDGALYDLPASDVIHYKVGVDPRNTRKGLSAIKAQIREIVTVNEESAYTASLLRNSAVPGLMIVPDDERLRPSKDDAEAIKARVSEAFGGDSRGGTMVMAGKYKVVPVGFSPEQLKLDTLPLVAVARVASAMGVAPMSLGLPDPGKTYANLAEANRASWSGVTALQDRMADRNRWALLPEFGIDPYMHVIEYDYNAIAELNESLDLLHARIREDYKAGLVTKNEGRELLGIEPDPDGDVFFPGTGGGEPVAVPMANPLALPDTNGKPPAEPVANGKGVHLEFSRWQL
jgi:HK97 family phage portal protein